MENDKNMKTGKIRKLFLQKSFIVDVLHGIKFVFPSNTTSENAHDYFLR